MAGQEAARGLTRIAALAAVVLALCLAACETVSDQGATSTGTGAAAPPPPPPPPAAAAAPATPRFAGGSVRKETITADRLLPPDGFGLYVYVLPERQVPKEALVALQRFHACLGAVRTGEARLAVAVMLLPVKSDAPSEIDPALSHDLVRTSYAAGKIDAAKVYVVLTNRPLKPGVAASGFIPIALPRMAPEFLTTWLVRLQSNIEQGQLREPRAVDLRIRNVLAAIGAAGELVGIKPAQAAELAC